jgi:hypothetical protein
LERSERNADLVLDEQVDKLLAVHEADWGSVGAGGFFPCTFTEVARSDDQPLFMGAETAAHLLVDGRQDVVFPALDLNTVFIPSERLQFLFVRMTFRQCQTLK